MFYKLDKGEEETDHSLMVESHLYFISICFKQKITAPKVQNIQFCNYDHYTRILSFASLPSFD